MGNNVFANGREIACKAADGKAIAAFPDVCFTPPQTPATPPGVPIPYPNTAYAKDTTKGSKHVKISSKEVMLKNSSYFKTSTGDEAGSAPKKGIINSKTKGKVYFNSWSMDVKIEAQNAVRHLDMTTHNHASPLGNEGAPWPYLDAAALADTNHPCNKYNDDVIENCPPPKKSLARGEDFSGGKLVAKPVPGPQDNTSSKCCNARKCMLVPESPKSRCSRCGKTPHHPVPVADLSTPRQPHPVSGKLKERGEPLFDGYKHNKAPSICLEGKDHNKREGPTEKLMEHGRVGRGYVVKRDAMLGDRKKFKFVEASPCAAEAVKDETECDQDCIQKQLDAGHEAMGVDKEAPKMRRGETRAPDLEKKPINPNRM